MHVINLKTVAFFFWLHFFANCEYSLAQPASMLFRNWQEATKLLDSASEEDRKHAEKHLRFELASPSTPVEAAWSLALFCAKRNDPAAVDRVLQGISQKFPALHNAAEKAITRLNLGQLLSSDAPSADIEKRIVEFSKSVQDSGAMEDRVLDAHFLGSIIGMYDVEAAAAPLSADAIYAIRQAWTKVPEPELRSAFAQSYDSTRSKAVQFANRIEHIHQVGLEQAKADQAARLVEIETLKDTLDADREAAKQIAKSSESQLKEVTQERKRLEGEIAKLNRELNIRTPGHPGPEKPPPIQPNRYDIYVDPVMVIEEIYTDSNGKPQVRQRLVNKTYAQIEFERDERYRFVLAEYNSLKQSYDQYASRYRQQLDAWNAQDKRRRDDVQQKRVQVEAQLAQARQAAEQLRGQSEEASKLLGNRIAHLKRMEATADLDRVILSALDAQKPASVFRPGNFELFHYAKEKRRILDGQKRAF